MDSLISNLTVVFNVVLVLFDEEPIVDNDPFLSSKSNCRVNPAPIIRTLKIETYGMRATRQPVAAFSSRKLKVRFLPPEIDSISFIVFHFAEDRGFGQHRRGNNWFHLIVPNVHTRFNF